MIIRMILRMLRRIKQELRNKRFGALKKAVENFKKIDIPIPVCKKKK